DRGAVMLIFLVFAFGVVAVLAAYFGVTKLPGYFAQRQLEARLEEVTTTPEDQAAKEHEALVKGRFQGPLPGLDRLVAGSRRGSAVATWVEQSGVKISVSALLLLSTVCGALFGMIVASAMRMGVGWLV